MGCTFVIYWWWIRWGVAFIIYWWWSRWGVAFVIYWNHPAHLSFACMSMYLDTFWTTQPFVTKRISICAETSCARPYVLKEWNQKDSGEDGGWGVVEWDWWLAWPWRSGGQYGVAWQWNEEGGVEKKRREEKGFVLSQRFKGKIGKGHVCGLQLNVTH